MPPDTHISMLELTMVQNPGQFWPGRTRAPAVAYLDLWPFQAAPFAASLDPRASEQVTGGRGPSALAKAALERDALRPLSGARDLVASDGAYWRYWRARFNPGFSARNVAALVPVIAEEAAVFVDGLVRRAGPAGAWGNVFQLERKATDLTFDVIGRAGL
jgi:cytochrome P450